MSEKRTTKVLRDKHKQKIVKLILRRSTSSET